MLLAGCGRNLRIRTGLRIGRLHRDYTIAMYSYRSPQAKSLGVRMDEQLIAFIDLLGFRSIITAQDDARQGQILSLLTSLAKAEGDFRSETRCIDARTRERAVWPAISAFSDHIAFSFTADGLAHVGAGLIVLGLADLIASLVFCPAIPLGCLVRGGIAFGPLHHGGGVLFGPGLVEAYELESKFAGRPRIIVSAGAAEKLGSNPYLHTDDDGFLCLDYVRAAYDRETQSNKRNWIARIRALCEDQISILTRTHNLPGLQNWCWFVTRFERLVANLHPSIRGDA
jgi:hypothetical protein